MLGRFCDWAEFVEADTVDLENLPRRALKAGFYDVKGRVSKEIARFLRTSNFSGMTEEKSFLSCMKI